MGFRRIVLLSAFGGILGSLTGLATVAASAGTCGGGTGYIAYANAGNQYGARVGGNQNGLLVVDTNAECSQVRSVVVWVDLQNYAEVGWFTDPAGTLDQCQDYAEPHLLVFARQGSIFKCKQNPPSLEPNTFYKVRVENPDHNNRMHYYLGSAYQGYYTVNFNQGDIESFTERKASSESLRASMFGLDYMGSSDNWNSWPNQTNEAVTPVGSWVFCEDSNTKYRVVLNSC